MVRLLRDNPTTLRVTLGKRATRPVLGRWLWFPVLAFGLLGLAISFVPSDEPLRQGLTAAGIKEAQAAVPAVSRDCATPHGSLQQDLEKISQDFNGQVGIAVVKVGCNWVAGDRSTEFFPQQSVSKLWVALTVLEAVDDGKFELDRQLAIRPDDLTLFNQPLRSHVLEQGVITRSVDYLLSDALSRSDNTANDRLLWTVGGPTRVRTMFGRKGITGIRFGPGERLLQSEIAGLQWSQELSLGRNFEQARGRLPHDVRQAALELYVAKPIDGAQPAGIARALAKLVSGELLSPASTSVMMDILSKTHSGPRRLKAGAPAGWKVFHKTGTGQELGRLATGYNDVGILQAPDGTEYALAVMIAQTSEPIPVRMEMMQDVTRVVASFHEKGSQEEFDPPSS